MRLSSSSSFRSLLLSLFLVFLHLPSHLTSDLYKTCRTLFKCGEFTAGYPFWGSNDRPEDCGHPDLKLQCENNITTVLEMRNVSYLILSANLDVRTFQIARKDYMDGFCSVNLTNTTLNPTLFDVVSSYKNGTFYYGCENLPDNFGSGRFNCESSGLGSGFVYEGVSDPLGLIECNYSVTVPVYEKLFSDDNQVTNVTLLESAMKSGFELTWKFDYDECDRDCVPSGGTCGFIDGNPTCYCADPPYFERNSCPSGPPSSIEPDLKGGPAKRKVVLALTFGLAGLLVAFVLAIFIYRKAVYMRNKRTITDHNGIEAFIENNRSLSPQRFNYLDVKKMTNSFADIVGKGGFGSVYRGKLPDGRLVAVKVLNTSKETNGEDFINEVASMSRTSHVNIVCLLGFCYEFIPNGSLDKFIYDKGVALRTKLETLEKTAVGVARGLEYLHRGCNTRIVHFDIKPHNILLDDDFSPKISDFGLAKLNQTKESIMSMLDTRGTVGYIAPEVFSRNFGRVSHKSDVYSYGMMVLEMVGGRRNFDRGVSHSSEMYFPDWIYKQLEPDENLRFCGDLTEEDESKARKMIIVGLWCIQTYPQNRPAMSKVVEMLEGSLELLQIPPKPVLSSPNESPEFLLTTSSSVDI